MKDNKELEKLVKNLFEGDQLDCPPLGFTEKVVQKIQEESLHSLKPSPLLPKPFFYGLGLLLVALITLVILESGIAFSVSDLTQFGTASEWLANLSKGFALPEVWGYILFATGIMVCAQAAIITKRYSPKLVQ
ncbi:MAG: hypothetical protein AAGF77_12030 [Bacteroidota bacterium]